MMKKILLFASCCTLLASSTFSIAAELCGRISADSGWGGGVFSVMDITGATIATTDYILTGNTGCTKKFPAGSYYIRFNGGTEAPQSSNNSDGCMTNIYVFNDETSLTVLFNQGQPPFNGDEYCFPPKL